MPVCTSFQKCTTRDKPRGLTYLNSLLYFTTFDLAYTTTCVFSLANKYICSSLFTHLSMNLTVSPNWLVSRPLSSKVNDDDDDTTKSNLYLLSLLYRLTIKAKCPMCLRNFPMDTQSCPLIIGSCKYTILHYIL